MPTISELRRDARDIFDFALKAVDPTKLVRQQLRLDGHRLEVAGRRYDLRGVDKVFLIAAGKAAAPMAGTLEDHRPPALGSSTFLRPSMFGTIRCSGSPGRSA